MPDVSLSPITYDPQANIELTLTSRDGLYDGGRRVTRTETTDGGVVVQDGGFTHGDRTFVFPCRVNRAEIERLAYMRANHSQLRCVTREGVFRVFWGGENSLTHKGNLVTLRFYAYEKEA